MKLTKIVATIGPSCDSPAIIEAMIEEGVDVFRFNFKHADIDWHEQRLKRVNEVAKKLKTHIGTLLDLQGPEIRVNLPCDEIKVEEGKYYPFGEIIFKKKIDGISISHPQIINRLKGGEKVLIDDGYFEFEVVKKGSNYFLLSKQDGVIKNKKNFNLLGVKLPFISLIEKDLKGLNLAVKRRVDFIALSFVRSADDILVLKNEMKKIDLEAKIIAKIETEMAIKNIDEIIKVADGIMVARGDLGIQLPLEQVPYHQKLIIEKARQNNKFVITATQMLQSMIYSKLPTRAEVSDVANACYDKTDAVMLSGETASGLHPLETVKMMKRVINFNEGKFGYNFPAANFNLKEKEEIISTTVVNLIKLEDKLNDSEKTKAIVVFTETGKTARLISANRPNLPIIAFVPEKKIADSLTVNYGVYPVVYSEDFGKEIVLSSIKKAIDFFIRTRNFKFKRGNFIVIHGDFWQVKGKITALRFFKFSN